MKAKIKSKMILLVRDHDNPKLILRTFRKDNIQYKIFVVHSTVEALDYIFHTGNYGFRPLPALILLDLNSASANVDEFLKVLKSYHRTQPLPVLSIKDLLKELKQKKQSLKILSGYIRKTLDFARDDESVDYYENLQITFAFPHRDR